MKVKDICGDCEFWVYDNFADCHDCQYGVRKNRHALVPWYCPLLEQLSEPLLTSTIVRR